MFTLFGYIHTLTLCTIVATASLLIVAYRKGSDNTKTVVTYSLALCCLISFPLQTLLFHLSDYPVLLENLIPFHLCDLAAIVCGIALLTKNRRLCELGYFWGLAGTIQGLITPDLETTFPSAAFVSFFWNHGFVVIAALFIPLALSWRPEKYAIWRAFGTTQIYVVLAMTLNHLLGSTNYGYLSHKPDQVSLLDFFPDWPWYILILELICLLLFIILTLPFSAKSQK